MTRDRKILYGISALLFALLLLLFILPISERRIVFSVLILLMAAVSVTFIKKRSIPSMNRRQVLLLMTVIAVLFIIIFYLSGFFFGFAPTYTALSLSVFLKYILPISVIIVSTEIIRGVFLAQESRVGMLFAYLFSAGAEILALGNLELLKTFNLFIDFVGLVVLPVFISNLLYNYISRRYGIYPNIAYRLITSLYSYVFFYIPAAPGAIHAFLKLTVPLLIFLFIDALYEKKVRYAIRRKSKLAVIGTVLGVFLMVSVIMIISCRFKYGAIVVSTESMTGEINKGDAVIYEAYDGDVISKGQVVVFKKGNVKIIHRVVNIERINNETRYYTKGDANESMDSGYITDRDIIGTVNFKIPYIGYPTVWIRNLFLERERGGNNV